MKILYLLFLLTIATAESVNAQNIGWQWAKQTVTGGQSENISVATDKFGNSFVAGKFTGNVSFGNLSVTSAGAEDGFLTKYDVNGNPVWVKSFKNPARAIARSVGVDSLGNSYIIGDFKDSVRIGNQLYFDNTSNLDQSGMFIIKYDSNGIQQWVKTAVAPRLGTYAADVTANKLAVSPGGTVFIFGDYTWQFKIEGISQIADHIMSTRPFIACYSNAGIFKWAKFPSGGNTALIGQGISTDSDDNCYLTGGSYGINFGQTVVLPNQGKFFIAKLDKFGNAKWAIGVGTGNRTYSKSITVNSYGKIFVAGTFETPTTIAGTSFTPSGFLDAFVAGFDSTGTPLWAKSISGTERETVSSLLATQSGVYVAGQFQATAIFGPNATKVSVGGQDAFIAHYDTNGNLDLAERIGGTEIFDFANDISLYNNDLIVAGSFKNNIPFGNIMLQGANESFLARSSFIIMGTAKIDLAKQIQVYPNPTNNLLRILPNGSISKANVTLHSITGQLVWHQELAVQGETELSLQALPAGLYYLTIQSKEQQMVTKIVKH